MGSPHESNDLLSFERLGYQELVEGLWLILVGFLPAENELASGEALSRMSGLTNAS